MFHDSPQDRILVSYFNVCKDPDDELDLAKVANQHFKQYQTPVSLQQVATVVHNVHLLKRFYAWKNEAQSSFDKYDGRTETGRYAVNYGGYHDSEMDTDSYIYEETSSSGRNDSLSDETSAEYSTVNSDTDAA